MFTVRRTHELVHRNPRGRENIMRASLEFLTGKAFVKVRPTWLRNPLTGRCLEIDAWCEELKLACEFQGYQHTTFPNCFHKSYDEFEKQQARDKFKADTLKQLGYRLLEVPHTVQASEIPSFLAERLGALDLLWRRHVELSDVTEESPEPSSVVTVAPAAAAAPATTSRRTPAVVDMSRCTPMFLVPGQQPDMSPRYTPESFDREWHQAQGYLPPDEPREPPRWIPGESLDD